MIIAIPEAAADPAIPTNMGAPIFVAHVEAPIWNCQQKSKISDIQIVRYVEAPIWIMETFGTVLE